jgi:hypothetical protein
VDGSTTATRAALGGVAGHAGLFSTASDLATYAQTLLDGGVGPNGVRVFAESTVRAFLRRSPGDTRRALGWETCGTDRDDVCGRLLDERAVMHTGFTGTFLVVDPVRQAFAVLLTNRVHAPRAAQPARVIRDVRADVADALALAVVDAPTGRWRCRWRSAPTATRTSGTPWRPLAPWRGSPPDGPSPGSPARWRPRDRRAGTSASPLPQGCARTAGDHGSRAGPLRTAPGDGSPAARAPRRRVLRGERAVEAVRDRSCVGAAGLS